MDDRPEPERPWRLGEAVFDAASGKVDTPTAPSHHRGASEQARLRRALNGEETSRALALPLPTAFALRANASCELTHLFCRLP